MRLDIPIYSNDYGKRHGLGKRDIAAYLEVMPSSITKWAKGESAPHPLIQEGLLTLLTRRMFWADLAAFNKDAEEND